MNYNQYVLIADFIIHKLIHNYINSRALLIQLLILKIKGFVVAIRWRACVRVYSKSKFFIFIVNNERGTNKNQN